MEYEVNISLTWSQHGHNFVFQNTYMYIFCINISYKYIIYQIENYTVYFKQSFFLLKIVFFYLSFFYFFFQI